MTSAGPSRTLTWDPGRLPPGVASGLLGPGAPFEMRDEVVLGTSCPCFVQRPGNVREALRRSAQERGDLDYLVFPERTLSVAATAAATGYLARRLHDDFGVQPGDRVAIAAANSLGHVVAWWAIVSSGAIAAGLNGWWAPPELAYGIELTGPRLVLADAKRRHRLLDAPLPQGTPLVDLDELLADALDHLDPAATGLPEVAIDEDDPLAILFTSGTTGRPKGAVVSHRNVAHVIMAVGLGGAITTLTAKSSLPPVDGQPTTILASPLFHVSGLLPLAVGAFFGTKLVFPPPGPWDETSHLELSQRHGVTSWSGVPAQLWRLLEHPDLGRYDLSRLRSFGGGGAMFPPELRRLTATKLPGVHMGTGYGMTETFGSGTRLSAAVAETHPASVGMVEPGTEIRTIGPDGQQLGDGEVGEVCIRGTAVFLGYWGDPDATKAVLDEDRWYRTGDFGRIEGDVLYLESRMRDLIIRGGENVYPIEIENRLVAHPDIEDACVVGVEHVQLGQEAAAVVVPRPDATLTADAVREWVAAALAPFKVPAHVLLRPILPYTQTGKLLKHEVEAAVRRQLHGTGELRNKPAATPGRLAVGPDTSADEVVAAVRAWVDEHVPAAWRAAAERGGVAAIREVRSRADYQAWYPTFGASGLVAPTWPVDYGGLDLTPAVARRVEAELAPYNLGRLNPLGLNLAAPALFAHGSEEQRLRYLPPIVRNEEVWCQLFSEPGAGSDLASLATRAERDGDDWVVTGQKVWTTWADRADFGVLLARTDPEVPKRKGITYFLVDMHAPGVEVQPLRHIGGEAEFNEVFLDRARVPDGQRVGDVGDGWRVAGATLSGERQMVAGSGSGGVDRIGGLGADHLVRLARTPAADGRRPWDDPRLRQEIMRLHSAERIRSWTNQRVRATLQAGRPPGPESSIGKVHQGDLNQRIQLLATHLLGAQAIAWESDAPDKAASLPRELRGMLRSRANTIEGGTTEVNKNILGERVLGLPREPDPYKDAPWREVPR